MKSNSILIAEKRKVFRLNTASQKIEWSVSFENKIAGITRVNEFVFISTASNWGKYYTSLLEFNTGKLLWTIDKILYFVHVFEETLIYIDKTKEIVSLSLNSGEEKFRVKMDFKWYESPRMALIENKIYLFSTKRTKVLNCITGSLSESKLPANINPKEVTFIIDEFQIEINTLPSGDAGDAMLYGMAIGAGNDGGGSSGGDAGE
ncbi:MAG: hypothetical protein L7S43_03935 [Flavobacteriaceae bacterium]|jgi:hypothetical protein|nr:hypothetical protein [Flavobacteriaceae bacterium]